MKDLFAVLSLEVGHAEADVKEIRQRLRTDLVRSQEFRLVKLVVDGVIAWVMILAVGVLLHLVLR